MTQTTEVSLVRDEAEFHPGAFGKKWTLKPPDNLFDRNRCAIDRSTAAALLRRRGRMSQIRAAGCPEGDEDEKDKP
jgi:hypothetical protein